MISLIEEKKLVCKKDLMAKIILARLNVDGGRE